MNKQGLSRLRQMAIVMFAVALTGCASGTRPPKAPIPLVVYDEGGNLNRPYIASGAEGNTSAIEMYRNCTTDPHTGQTCWKMVYAAVGAWGAVMLQNPAGNWGDRPGGWDLTGASKLTFWARGETEGKSLRFRMAD